MSYEIKIKGLNDPVRIDNHHQGTEIKKKWEAYHMNEGRNEIIDIDSWTGKISDIGYFKKISSKNSDNAAGKIVDDEYLKERRDFLSLTAEQKAKKMGVFRFIYWGFTGMKSEDVKIGDKPIEQFAEEIQLKFYQENPKRMICDPILFKPLIKSAQCNNHVMYLTNTIINQDRLVSN